VIRTFCVLLAAGALAVAGCGGNDNNNSAQTTSADQSTSTAADASAAKTVGIDMKNTAFEPNQVTVKVGQTVRWENYDGFDHNVVATEGETFKSDNFGKGGEYKYTVDKPGTIKYVCTLHPGMEGTITVTQ
jgi:plastocyanin